MTIPRSKAQIQSELKERDSYRDDLEYIQETLSQRQVFIGQTTSEQLGNTEASFWVTVGMYQQGLPELVLTGVPLPLVKGIVEELFQGHDFDRKFLAGARTKVIHGLQAMALPVINPENHDVLSVCLDIYTLKDMPRPEVVQIVFADEFGSYPWSIGYASDERKFQPVLGMQGCGVSVN
jgi:hypothetical protein